MGYSLWGRRESDMHTHRYMNLLKKFDLFLVKKNLLLIIVNKMPYLLFSCVVIILIVITKQPKKKKTPLIIAHIPLAEPAS